MKNNIVKIGQTVYTIYEGSIEKNKVGFIGKESFIIENFRSGRQWDSIEWDYDGYNESWTFSLTKAKEILLKRYQEIYDAKFIIKRLADDYWECWEEI